MIIIKMWLLFGIIICLSGWIYEYIDYKRKPYIFRKFKPTDIETIITYLVLLIIYPVIPLLVLYRKIKR